MEIKKNLYPIKFIPVAMEKPWGGNALIKKLGKEFVECDEDGNEVKLTSGDKIGESWEMSDMGFVDSVVANGWLAGNTFEEIMETYFERIVGEDVYQYYGRQFPVLVKFLDIQGRMSVQVNPDDEIAGQRYDTLGKCKFWYIMDAAPDARIYMGFKQEISARELYDRCRDGSITDAMNAISPRKGDSLLIRPGTVHSADTDVTETLASVPQFTVNGIKVHEPLEISTEHFGSFLIYICIEGGADIQFPSVNGDGRKCTESCRLGKGETVLIPADMPDFFIVPLDRDTSLLEVMIERREEIDSYINPDTEPYLEGEDYGGAEDEDNDDQ